MAQNGKERHERRLRAYATPVVCFGSAAAAASACFAVAGAAAAASALILPRV